MALRRLNHIFGKKGSSLVQLLEIASDAIIVRQNHFLQNSPNAVLDKSLINRYKKLKYPPKLIQVTYMWIDGTGEGIRLKDKVIDKQPKCVEELPHWHCDGSSTYQAEGENSDITLVPRAMYRDPFHGGKNDIIALCDTYFHDGNPTPSNKRKACMEACDAACECEPWFGIEQEYTLFGLNGRPFGWPMVGYPEPQGPYYCAVGADRVYGRDIVEAHAYACLYAGIDFCGTNAEVLPSQWEYQVGASLGIKAADDIWVSRFILHRIAEEFGVLITLDPKPQKGMWNGSGAHTNFSTKEMRDDDGIKAIEAAMPKLEKNHIKHIGVYDPHGGKDNERRLIGHLETSSIEKFSWGVDSRSVSVRIPRSVATEGKGFFEDRRPSANMDPYQVCEAIINTVVLDK